MSEVRSKPKSQPETDSEGCNPRSLIAITIVLVMILIGIGYWLVNR